jgi:hypothetical protein
LTSFHRRFNSELSFFGCYSNNKTCQQEEPVLLGRLQQPSLFRQTAVPKEIYWKMLAIPSTPSIMNFPVP